MNKNTVMSQKYRGTKRGHIATLLSRARRRARDQRLGFDLDIEYLLSLPSDICPVFGIALAWCNNSKIREDNSPSLDKIDPAKGYIRGNVAWLSWRANRIKNDGSALDHEKIFQWLRANTN